MTIRCPSLPMSLEKLKSDKVQPRVSSALTHHVPGGPGVGGACPRQAWVLSSKRSSWGGVDIDRHVKPYRGEGRPRRSRAEPCQVGRGSLPGESAGSSRSQLPRGTPPGPGPRPVTVWRGVTPRCELHGGGDGGAEGSDRSQTPRGPTR